MKRFSIPPREERERHSHTMSAYEASSNYIFEFGLLFFYLYMFLLHSSKKLYYTLMRI